MFKWYTMNILDNLIAPSSEGPPYSTPSIFIHQGKNKEIKWLIGTLDQNLVAKLGAKSLVNIGEKGHTRRPKSLEKVLNEKVRA